jgi:uncharacterized C2H2 Zn-finger protein
MHKNAPNVPDHAPNVPDHAPNVPPPAPNVPPPAPNVPANKSHSCDRCGKTFSRNKILVKHLLSCKGVENSLECPNCHTVFNARSSKCRHMKACESAPTINNTTNNIHNGHNIDNSLTINQIFINDFGKEDKSYINAVHTNGLNGLPIFFISIPSIGSSKNYLKIT